MKLLILMATFSITFCLGCKNRVTESSVYSSSSEREIRTLEDLRTPFTAWFLGSHKLVKWCMQVSPEVSTVLSRHGHTSDMLRRSVEFSYQSWMKYLQVKNVRRSYSFKSAAEVWRKHKPTSLDDASKSSHVNLSYMDPFHMEQTVPSLEEVESDFAAALHWQSQCDAATDLIVHFGEKPQSIKLRSSAEPATILGAVFRDERAVSGTWQKGHIWIAPPATTAAHGMDYRDELVLVPVLIHEFGHVLGNGHVAGTVMDPEYIAQVIDTAKAMRQHSKPIREQILTNALLQDQERILYFCHDCPQIAPGSIFGMPITMHFTPSKYIAGLSVPIMGKIDIHQSYRKNLQVIVDEPIAEVFAKQNAPEERRMFHRAFVSAAQYENDQRIQIELNTNRRGEAPIRAINQCQGQNFLFFSSWVMQMGNIFDDISWMPREGGHFRAEVEYIRCAKNVKLLDVLEERVNRVMTVVAQYSIGQDRQLGQVPMNISARDPAVPSWPEASFCGELASQLTLCLRKAANFVFFELRQQGKVVRSLSQVVQMGTDYFLVNKVPLRIAEFERAQWYVRIPQASLTWSSSMQIQVQIFTDWAGWKLFSTSPILLRRESY